MLGKQGKREQDDKFVKQKIQFALSFLLEVKLGDLLHCGTISHTPAPGTAQQLLVKSQSEVLPRGLVLNEFK